MHITKQSTLQKLFFYISYSIDFENFLCHKLQIIITIKIKGFPFFKYKFKKISSNLNMILVITLKSS
jgi:hypothetical protein